MCQGIRAIKVKNSSETISPTKIIFLAQSQDVHHEVELGVVIGKTGRHISRTEAEGHILGYCIFLDITARDIQKEETKRGGAWALAKGDVLTAEIEGIGKVRFEVE